MFIEDDGCAFVAAEFLFIRGLPSSKCGISPEIVGGTSCFTPIICALTGGVEDSSSISILLN